MDSRDNLRHDKRGGGQNRMLLGGQDSMLIDTRTVCSAVFDARRNMELVMDRLRDTPDFRDVAPALFFKALPDVTADFAGGWERLHEPPGMVLPGVGNGSGEQLVQIPRAVADAGDLDAAGSLPVENQVVSHGKDPDAGK